MRIVLLAALVVACKEPELVAGPEPERPPAIALDAEDAIWKDGAGAGALVVPVQVTNHLSRGVVVDVVSLAVGDCQGEAAVGERLAPGGFTHVTVTIPCTRDQVGETVELSAVAIYETNDQKRTASVAPTVKVTP